MIYRYILIQKIYKNIKDLRFIALRLTVEILCHLSALSQVEAIVGLIAIRIAIVKGHALG